MTEPVLIVGAGPVGLTMALALKRWGVDLRIIDKTAARTGKSKALVLWPRTLEMLDIQGCVQSFVDAGMKAVGARIFAQQNVLMHIRLDRVRGAYPYALMVPQSDTERLLEEQLALIGVHVERRVELISFVDNGDGITAVLRHADGHDETVNSSYLAGCDGAHSTTRHALAAPFEGDTLPSGWMLADVELDGKMSQDELTICWTPDGVLLFVPIKGARFRVIADVGLSPVADESPLTLEEVQALLDLRGLPGLRAHDPVWMSRFRINERKVKDYRQGRVFLCGDAAHVHSPAGGQGMNTGMQDSFNLAWKLAMVWHGQASPALLDTYSPERSAVGDQVLRNAGILTKVAILRNPILQRMRNLAVSALGRVPRVRQRMVDQLTEMDLHYRNSPLTLTSQGAARRPSLGERAPDIPLSVGGGGASRLHEILATGKFAVLSVAAAAVTLPDAVQFISTAAGAATDQNYEAGHVYLIRPDAYVVMSTKSDNTAAIISVLERIAAGA
ncbi:MAG: FAD-binding monooxygenase [Candidimonas sp.]|nr:MAG: FAD-binding monooxygenase [Candidimonas sp.]TAM23878.1 MAG: FAD-binding monooxygenase [Candidimonas sp.]TAM79038.1 MAG: FAD-binding monooxygenase [Candidimonas sp.]